MPVIQDTRHNGNIVTSELVDSVGIAERTYTFPDATLRETLEVSNESGNPLVVSVGTQVNVVIPGFQSQSFAQSFIDFKMKAQTGHSSFRVRASYRESDEEDERDLAAKLKGIGNNTSIVLRPTGGNDTSLINDTLTLVSTNARLKKVVLDGEFIVTALSGFTDIINMKSNCVLEFTKGSKITLSTNGFDGYYIIGCVEINNFEIINPYIVGDRDTHTGTTGEYGHGIRIKGCKDWNILNLYVEKCWGDGISISNNNAVVPENGYIDKVKTYKCSRNGVTLASGRNIRIDYIESQYTDRTLPMTAVDFESNTTNEVWDFSIGKIKSVSCPEGIGIIPTAMSNYAYTSKINIDIGEIEIIGTDSSDTGQLWISNETTKVTGKIKIGKLYVDKTDKAIQLYRMVNGGIELEIEYAKLVTEVSSTLASEGAVFIDTSFYPTKNVGKIFIGELDVTGTGRYLLNVVGQQSGTPETSNLRINRIRNKANIPSRINGVMSKLTEGVLSEVNISQLSTTYNVGNTWFTLHFLSNLYHNESATADSFVAPSLGEFKMIDTPITLENRVGTYNFGLSITGKTILPASLAYTNGFKSTEKGARIKFKQLSDGSIYVLEKIGNWISYT